MTGAALAAWCPPHPPPPISLCPPTPPTSQVEAPKPEQRAAPAPVQQAAPAAAVKKEDAKEEEAKSAKRLAAEQAAAQLAAELSAKQEAQQQAKAAAAAPTNYTSLGVGVLLAAAAALAAPQSRAAARSLLDRFRGEAALVKAAQVRYETLKKSVEVQAGDFSRLQVRACCGLGVCSGVCKRGWDEGLRPVWRAGVAAKGVL